MKHKTILVHLLICAAFYIDPVYAAENTQEYKTMPFDYARDYAALSCLLQSDGQKLNDEDNDSHLSEAWKYSLKNNTPMNPNGAIIKDSFHRVALRSTQDLVGFASYFLSADDYDTVKRNDGYIETLYVKEGSAQASYAVLIKNIVLDLKDRGALHIIIHLNGGEQPLEYNAIIAVGFAVQTQTNAEKKRNAIRLQINHNKRL